MSNEKVSRETALLLLKLLEQSCERAILYEWDFDDSDNWKAMLRDIRKIRLFINGVSENGK